MFLFLHRVCTMTEDQTQTVSGAHSPRFVFRFSKVFCFVPVSLFPVCPAAWKLPLVISHHSPLQDGVGVRRGSLAGSPRVPRVRWPRALMPADRGRYPKPAGGLPSSRVAAPPGAPFAGDHATGSPLTQCPPAHL